jgi:hypothetical protein
MRYHHTQARFSSLRNSILAAATISLMHCPAAKAQGPLDDFPLVITCQNKDTYHVFYLSRIAKDGTATFTASDRLAGTITVTGQAKAVGDALSGGSCAGKSLEDLRASGQARDAKR